MDILKMISEYPDGIKISELTRNLNLKYTTVYNLVMSMEKEKMISRDSGSNKLFLGIQLSEFHRARMNGKFLLHARKFMELIQEKYPDSNLTYSQFRNNSVIALLNRSTDFAGMIRDTKSPLPIYQTVAGIVFLAFLPETDSRNLRLAFPLNPQLLELWGGESVLEETVRLCRTRNYAQLPFDPPYLTRIGIPLFCRGQLTGALTCSRENITVPQREHLIRQLRSNIEFRGEEFEENSLSFHA